MSKITIFLRKDAGRRDGTFPLYACVSRKGKRTRFPIDVCIPENKWDPKKQLIKGTSQEDNDNNLIVANARAKISDILVRARLSNEKLTGPMILSRYKLLDEGNSLDEISENFIFFARKYLREISGSLAPNTYRVRMGIIKKIENYEPTVTLLKITPEWLRQYVSYCRNVKQNSPGTIKKNLDTIHLLISVALRKGLIKEDPFNYYKLQPYQSKIVFLNEDEFRKLIRLHSSGRLPDYQQKILDLFLFMTFTGMHFSDAGNLRLDDIQDGEIHYRRMKTGTLADVPVTQPAQKIIDKYKGDRENGRVFLNFPTNEYFNRAIKDICSIVRIRKTVSAKTARHTFATLFYKKTKDIGTLARLLGHSSVRCTMIYAHIMKEDRVAGMAFFDDMM